MTEQEFKLQEQIWELKNQNTALTIVLVVLGILVLFFLSLSLYNTFVEENK